MKGTKPKLLVVDDQDRYIELAHALLRDYDYATRCDLPGPCWTCSLRDGCTLTHAHDAKEAEEALKKHPDVDVVMLDVAFDLPEERLLPPPPAAKNQPAPTLEQRQRHQGIEILAHLRRSRGDLPVVLMTSESELGYEDAARRLAADEFATLAGEAAFDARALTLLVERVLARHHDSPEAGGYTWGTSSAMARLRRDALALARTSLPMLVLGEPGTGKSALAERVVHPATRRKGPFVAVDLASIPESLAAAELFGTARGAFSGAVDRRGRFEEAQGGTLFLDEIGNLPPEAQRMLLLALQDRRITRLGESTPRAVDVKLIAATNADLLGKVRAGAFRADLYARLNPAARLVVPALRDRAEDIPELLATFVKKKLAQGPDRELLAEYLEAIGEGGPLSAELTLAEHERTRRAAASAAGRKEPTRRGIEFVLDSASSLAVKRHPFLGNVRELELFIANAIVFALSDALSAAREGRAQKGARTIPIPGKLVQELLAAEDLSGSSSGSSASAEGGVLARPKPGASLHAVASDLERQLYQKLFSECEGDFDRMARSLFLAPDPSSARKVRLRFNQLGLRARKPRSGS
jgi:DNA-binding NtrC family response regulator